MRNKITAVLLIFTLAVLSVSCNTASKDDKTVIIYSAAEEFRNEYFSKRIKEEFPDYDVIFETNSTGVTGAKLKAEGLNTPCDIVLGLEYGYLESLKDNFADLSGWDTSAYIESYVPKHMKYIPFDGISGAVVINNDVLNEKGLKKPEAYADLLDPQYKGLISAPNPKSSGTGYTFLKSLVNQWGEEEAFDYFDKLSENILQYTASGSGPVKALTQGEAAIGFGMVFQAVMEQNNGVNLEIVFFPEGATNMLEGTAIIEGKQNKEAVIDIFNFFYDTLCMEDKELFMPEKIYKEQASSIPGYPEEIIYSEMAPFDTVEAKNLLLEKWKY